MPDTWESANRPSVYACKTGGRAGRRAGRQVYMHSSGGPFFKHAEAVRLRKYVTQVQACSGVLHDIHMQGKQAAEQTDREAE